MPRHEIKQSSDRIYWPRPKVGSRSTSYQRARGVVLVALSVLGSASINAAGRWSLFFLALAGFCFGMCAIGIARPWGRDL